MMYKKQKIRGHRCRSLRWKVNFPLLFSFSQFFSDVKEAEEKLKKMQDTMKRKYTCDRSITVTRLEDLLQDAAVRQPRLSEPIL